MSTDRFVGDQRNTGIPGSYQHSPRRRYGQICLNGIKRANTCAKRGEIATAQRVGGEYVKDRGLKRIVAVGGIATGDGVVVAPQVGMANHHSAAVYVVCQHIAHRCGIGKGEVESISSCGRMKS